MNRDMYKYIYGESIKLENELSLYYLYKQEI